MTQSRDFKPFQYFNFEKGFLKNEDVVKETEYCFSVESATVESVTLS